MMALPVNPNGIPAEMKAEPRWGLWKNAPRDGKLTKVPFQPSGIEAKSNDPETWGPFEDALDSYERGGFDGLAFFLGDGWTGIDCDSCRDPDTGAIDPWGRQHLNEFSDTYGEVSPTGTGFKLIVKGELPTPKSGAKTSQKKGNAPLGVSRGGKEPGVEAYHKLRFFAITGHKLPEAVDYVAYKNGELTDWFNRTFADRSQPKSAATGSTWGFDGDRRKLIERAICYLQKCNASVSGQRGHDDAFHAACVAVCEFGLSADEAWQALQDWNARCIPPWSEDELRRKIDEADKEPKTYRLRDAELPGGKNDTQGCQSESDQPEKPRRPVAKFTLRGLCEEHPYLRPVLIDGLIRKGETINLISVTKIGKSWLAGYIAICVVLGLSIFGRFATTAGKVLIIDNELHPETIASRLRTILNAMGVLFEDVADLVHVWSLRGNLLSLAELDAELAGVPKDEYALIIGDAKYRFVGPDEDENSNADQARFYNTVDQIAGMTGAAVLLVHHSTKGSQSDRRVTDVGSGAGSQSRAADCHLVLREHEEPDCVVLDAAVRSFKPIEPMCLRFRFPLWEVADDLDPGELKGKKSRAEEKQDKQDQEAQGKVLDKAAAWISRPQLKTATGLGYGRLDRAIARLIDGKFLESEDRDREGKTGPKTATFYRKTINARA